ncbi:hypothetical protein MY4824_009231 [Beauveria thailandica]
MADDEMFVRAPYRQHLYLSPAYSSGFCVAICVVSILMNLDSKSTDHKGLLLSEVAKLGRNLGMVLDLGLDSRESGSDTLELGLQTSRNLFLLSKPPF